MGGAKQVFWNGSGTHTPLKPHPLYGDTGEEVWSRVENNVVYLTESTFDDVMSVSPSSLVMYYAPWCGYCMAIKPAYTKAAIGMGQDIPGSLVAVGIMKEMKLCKRFSGCGYPTLLYVADGALQ